MKPVFIAVAAVLCAVLGSCLSSPYDKETNLNDLSIDESALRIEKELRNDALYRTRALKNSEAGRYSEAVSDATRAIEINPGNFENWNTRGEIYFEMGQLEKSASDFRRVLQLSPGTSHAYRGLYRCFRAKGEYDKALLCVNKLVEIEPENYASYMDRGVMRGAALDLTGSLADFDTAIRLNAGHPDAWVGRATIHYYLKNYQKSIDDMTVYISLESKPDWRTVDLRGKAYEALAGQIGDEAQKAEYLEKSEADLAWSRELRQKQQIVGQK
jgi:tetratricopeptide (TPR) repeat protein